MAADSAADRISRMEKHVKADSDINQEFYTSRIEKLKRLTKAGRKLLPALAGLLKI